MKMAVVKITEFSPFPAGRYTEDGPFSGEAFRDRILIPNLTSNDVVKVDLNGAFGFGSSFLEEAFGGLVRVGHFSLKVLKEKLKIESEDDPMVVDEIWHYIKSAR